MIRQQIFPAILVTLALTIFTGFVFPGVVWIIGQLLFSYQANGSLIETNGTVIGSELIGQNFAAPQYFHSRPSAAGSGYDPLASGGTNLGPTSKKLFVGQPDNPDTKTTDESFSGVVDLAKAYRNENGLSDATLIPADAVTRSASGLDPDISPLNAKLQVPRIARERGQREQQIQEIVSANTHGRFLGIFGEPRVNVLLVNLELDRQFKH